MDPTAAAITAGAIVAFILFWVSIVLVIGVLSGWRSLAKHYRSDVVFTGSWRGIRRARLGFSAYKGGALRAGADPMGLHLAPAAVFRPGHPPLFIPWSEIQHHAAEGFFGRAVVFTFARAPRITLSLTEDDAKAIADARASGALYH
jgi:hypothetical protein